MNKNDELVLKIRKKFGAAWFTKHNLIEQFLARTEAEAVRIMSEIQRELPDMIAVRMSGQLLAFREKEATLPSIPKVEPKKIQPTAPLQEQKMPGPPSLKLTDKEIHQYFVKLYALTKGKSFSLSGFTPVDWRVLRTKSLVEFTARVRALQARGEYLACRYVRRKLVYEWTSKPES